MDCKWTSRLALIAAGTFFWVTPALADSAEQRFGGVVELLTAGQSQDALQALEQLAREQPEFRLGTQFYGQLQTRLSAGADATQLAALAAEARLRLDSEQAIPPVGEIPDAVLQLAGSFRHLVVVDLPRARLYLFANDGGELKLLRSHYASVGKNGWGKEVAGDHRTPVGLYHVTGWIDGAQLPELYGDGAFPLNYPNLWDRAKQRSGFGIWLHGVPGGDAGSRPPRSSEGCVTMANADLRALREALGDEPVPVLLSDALAWTPPAAVVAARDDLLAYVDGWREAWSEKGTDTYAAFYAGDFSSGGLDREAYTARQRRVAGGSYAAGPAPNLFRYPSADGELVMAEFTGADGGAVRLQQIWQRQDSGGWKILREDSR